MNRFSSKRSDIFLAFTFLVFYLLTASLVPRLAIRMDLLSFGGAVTQSPVRPDLLFGLVLATSILFSRKQAVIFGIIAGFLVDVTVGAPVFSPLCYFICGYYAGTLASSLAGHGVVNAVLAALPLLLVKAVISTFYLLGTWHDIGFLDILFGAVLPEYLYNLVAAALVFLILRGLCRLFRIDNLM